ncbi:MAG: hypothetical protein EOO41_05470 [Methanobacteriota archaeon]|nr:MAG: hypothetical protein EOO41_05470 [Euryarchaeota archaeon]
MLLTLQFPLGMFPPARVEDFTRGPPFLLRREFYDEVLRENFDLTSKGDVPEDMSPVDREGLEAFAWWTLRA